MRELRAVRSQREIFHRMDFRGRTEMLQAEYGRRSRPSVIKGRHMMVCYERAYYNGTPSRVAPQEFLFILSQQSVELCWDFFIR